MILIVTKMSKMESFASNAWLFLFVLSTPCVCSEVSPATQITTIIPCFWSCVCNNGSHIHCTADKTFTLHIADFNYFLLNASSGRRPQVHMQTKTESLPSFLPRLPVLHYLSLAQNSLTLIQNSVLKGMRLRALNLSHNAIKVVEEEAFQDLYYLQQLDLSHNRLSSLSRLLFSDLPNLKVLNLDCNELLYFPFDASSRVPHLEELTLNHNQLSYLMPDSLLGLPALCSLELRNNSLRSLVVEIAGELPTLQVLDLSDNPFHCSCSLRGLADIVNSNSEILVESNRTTCFTPLSLRGLRVVDVVTELQECQRPQSVLSYDSQSVPYTGDIKLSCNVQGNPDPAVFWLTPWGDQFADPVHWPQLESVCTSCQQQRHYHSKAVSLESTVSVISGGKNLRITNFRGFFNGNISCHAYNYLGNDTSVRYVQIFSAVQSTVHDSMYMGGICAGGFLCLGLLIGSIKLLVLACMTRFGVKAKVVRTPTTSIFSCRDRHTSSMSGDSQCRDYSLDVIEEFDCPSSILATVSPATSPMKAVTSDNSPEMLTDPCHLRQGMGRKMKTVRRNVQSIRKTGRRNVQSIRESGSVYMQNIMESGSTAANRVKAGVVMGVESVKSHMQSIKEFCGSGDMGTHTGSAVSLETNVDTNETREVVKSVTFV